MAITLATVKADMLAGMAFLDIRNYASAENSFMKAKAGLITIPNGTIGANTATFRSSEIDTLIKDTRAKRIAAQFAAGGGVFRRTLVTRRRVT